MPSLRRWLLPSELAAATGFPVRTPLAEAAGLPLDEAQYALSQLGNAMHLANVGCVAGVALSCLQRTQE